MVEESSYVIKIMSESQEMKEGGPLKSKKSIATEYSQSSFSEDNTKNINENNNEDLGGGLRNKYKATEKKYILLKEGYFNEEEYMKKVREIEENIRLFRLKMKEFESYINEIKQLTEGDYDHYYEILKKTNDKNVQFMLETQNIDEQLNSFELILKEKQEENEQLLKDINEHFNENGMMIESQDNDKNNEEEEQNKIIEEDEEKQQEVE